MTEGNKNYTETEIMLGALDRVIREEMKKRPSKRDNKLIDECIVEMAKLKNVRTGYTEEEIGAIVEQIEAKAAKKTERVPVRRKSIRRIAAVVCAACLIMAGSVAAVAWNPFDVCMPSWISGILQLPIGSEVKSHEITYSHQGKTEKYGTVEELIKSENLNIYYPSVLPDNLYIREIEIVTISNSEYINIYFNYPSYEFTIQKNSPLYISISEYETVNINDITYYIAYQNDRYVARALIDSNLYFIECHSYQDILLMANNLTRGD